MRAFHSLSPHLFPVARSPAVADSGFVGTVKKVADDQHRLFIALDSVLPDDFRFVAGDLNSVSTFAGISPAGKHHRVVPDHRSASHVGGRFDGPQLLAVFGIVGNNFRSTADQNLIASVDVGQNG